MKWRVDWSSYDCDYVIIEAETAREAAVRFDDMWHWGKIRRNSCFPNIEVSKGEEYDPVDKTEWKGKIEE